MRMKIKILIFLYAVVESIQLPYTSINVNKERDSVETSEPLVESASEIALRMTRSSKFNCRYNKQVTLSANECCSNESKVEEIIMAVRTIYLEFCIGGPNLPQTETFGFWEL